MSEVTTEEMIEQVRLKGLQNRMDELNDRIDHTVAQLSKEKEELQSKIVDTAKKIEELKLANLKWNPKWPSDGTWLISNDNKVVMASSKNSGCLEAGKYRGEIETAKKAAEEMRKFSRLLAYRDEFDPNFEWVKGKSNCFVYCVSTGEWVYSHHTHCQAPGLVYMSNRVAKELVDKLNMGIVVL